MMKTSTTETKTLVYLGAIKIGEEDCIDLDITPDDFSNGFHDAVVAAAAGAAGFPMKENSARFDNNRDIQRLESMSQSLRMPTEVDTSSDVREDPTKENHANFDDKRKIHRLASKASQFLRRPSKVRNKSKVSAVPDKKDIFQDKDHFEGKRQSIDSKKKKTKIKDDESKALRRQLATSQKRILGLQDELKQKDEQLLKSQTLAVEKVKELEEMSEFMTSLQDLLREMGCTGPDAKKLMITELLHDTESSGNQGNEESELGVTLKECKKDWNMMLESLESQGSLMESLKNLNADHEKTISSLIQVVHEKDQALAEMEHFSTMNECANDKILACTREQHEQEKTQLIGAFESQIKLIDSLKCLNDDSIQTISSLTQLISEKDKALAEFSHFNVMDNFANSKLLAHANEKHYDEIRELHCILSATLREKYKKHRELALLKLQIEDGSEMKMQYLVEVKFFSATLAIFSILMAVMWQHSWFLLISPVYFGFAFWSLE